MERGGTTYRCYGNVINFIHLPVIQQIRFFKENFIVILICFFIVSFSVSVFVVASKKLDKHIEEKKQERYVIAQYSQGKVIGYWENCEIDEYFHSDVNRVDFICDNMKIKIYGDFQVYFIDENLDKIREKINARGNSK